MSKNDISILDRVSVNVTEAAKMMGVSVPTMRGFVSKDDFPAFRMGRQWIIPVDLFKEWIANHASKGD